ncbi:MAG: hypothetical protein ACE5LC_09955 [Candidatus Aminicenantales bacterium]
MKSITIHGLDEELENILKKRAKSEEKSVNKIVKELLRKALGIGVHRKNHRDEFLDLFGVWTKQDERIFTEAIKDLEAINTGDWP